MSYNKGITRRHLFENIADGLSGAALASLLGRDLYAGTPDSPEENGPAGHRRLYDLKPRPPHFEPHAKAVIQLFMNGGPSQMDLFDPKPILDKHDGEPYFEKIAGDVSSVDQAGGLMRSPFKF